MINHLEMSKEILKNINLHDIETINKIFGVLEKKIGYYKTVIHQIQSHENILDIMNSSYSVTSGFSGARCWIMMFIMDNVHYFISFPQKNIKRKDEIKLFAIPNKANPILYKTTIMEGIYFKHSEKKYFAIDNIHYYAGENMYLKTRTEIFNKISKNFQKDIHKLPSHNIVLRDNYSINENNFNSLYEEIQINPHIREIIFWPERKSKTEKIYSYTINDFDKNIEYIESRQMYMIKKNLTDVYELEDYDGKKMGIAYIPDINTSTMCSKWFKTKKKNKLKVLFHKKQHDDKWIPIHKID